MRRLRSKDYYEFSEDEWFTGGRREEHVGLYKAAVSAGKDG
jgi:hypothetical protein